MSMSFSDPDEVAKRKATFSRMARMIIAERDQYRQKTFNELKEEECTPSASQSRTTRGWRTEEEQVIEKESQLAYAEPYKVAYSILRRDQQQQQGAAADLEDAAHLENESSAASTVSQTDTLERLPTQFRPARGMRGRGPLSTRSSVVDFERTSTIQPPSEASPGGEYTSNVSTSELRRQYFSSYRTNQSLPIYGSRSYLINSVKSYSVVIIEGATGCGKTTQVPMYILEDALLDNPQPTAPVIYVTQPRRIAAKSIANRVCDEHGWTVGSIVGYQVGMEKNVGPETVLVYCTAGVLLQKLIQDKSLQNYTHIVIDEAHERDADTDLLLMMIRKLMHKESSFFHLIVMSATIDLCKLKNYFTFRISYGHRGITTPALCRIGPPKQPTSIQNIYFDKLRTTFQIDEPMPQFDAEQPEVHDECLNAAVKIIVDVIPHLDTYSEDSKTTLVFLPGLAEISKLHRLLRPSARYLDIIPLHSSLAFRDQQRVFEPSQPGFRKVVLATNIAESSITVKDAGFIIDFCLTKTLIKGEITRFPTLKLQWSTIDKSTQRAGRTGRCCPGKVFRMVSQAFFKSFKEYAEPELLTSPLELSVLRVKNFQMGEIKALLAVVMDPPPLNEIRTAVLELKQIGALTSTYDGRICDLDGDLTELGKVIASLPIDVHLSKLIVVASLLDVLQDAIIVAACLSTNRTVVKQLYGNLVESYHSKLNWAHGSFSDLFVSLDVYREFVKYKDEKNRTPGWLSKFCNDRNLDEGKLYEVSALVQELEIRLENINIKNFEQPNRPQSKHEDEMMLKVAFCASFYPNYFLSQDMDPPEIKKSLCGLDPTKTVILSGFPVNSVPLYRSQILHQIPQYGITCDIDFITDVSRALLVLNDENTMGEDESAIVSVGLNNVIDQSQGVRRSVYTALKAAESDYRLMIREYKEIVASDRMQYYKDARARIEGNARNKLMPSWTKLVVGRPANNSRIIDLTQEEFYANEHDHFIEIEFNERQDREDRNDLSNLEQIEENMIKRQGRLDNTIDHHIFKTDYRPVRGPESPIKMTFRSILEKSRGYNVDIEPHSVNSILLNPNYQKPRRQMLIAAAVGQTKRGRIIARDTTLMPNIRGLPTLMSLMFAQYYRLVYNEEMKCIAGAVFGLGWDEEDKTLDKDYEVELNFDVHINKNDIELINKVRYYFSQLIKYLDVANPGAPRAELQFKLRKVILALMRVRRFPIPEMQIAQIDWEQGRFVKDKHNIPKQHLEKLEPGDYRTFLPIVEASKTYNEQDTFAAIRENLNHMNRIADCEILSPKEGLKCLLCGGGVSHFLLMHGKIVKHLEDPFHLGKLEEFESFERRFAESTPGAQLL